MEKGITLVIPLYNKQICIRNTLDSVLKNHGEYPFKCIIVDDDSNDMWSSFIGEEYDTKYPDTFMYIKRKHHEIKVPSQARNLGIKLADTEYIAFLDADDELCPGFIDRGCTFLDEHPEYSMYGNGNISRVLTEDGTFVEYDWKYSKDDIHTFLDYIFSGGSLVCFCANIYRTELVKNNLFEDIYGEDSLFQLKYVYENEPIYIDNSTCESFIYNRQFSESIKPPDKNTFKIIEEKIPNMKYTFYVDENNVVWYKMKEK